MSIRARRAKVGLEDECTTAERPPNLMALLKVKVRFAADASTPCPTRAQLWHNPSATPTGAAPAAVDCNSTVLASVANSAPPATAAAAADIPLPATATAAAAVDLPLPATATAAAVDVPLPAPPSLTIHKAESAPVLPNPGFLLPADTSARSVDTFDDFLLALLPSLLLDPLLKDPLLLLEPLGSN